MLAPGARTDGIAWGKVILLGEHAVVHGHPALAAALDRGVRCVAEPSEAPTRLRIAAWDVDVTAGEGDFLARALACLARAAGVGDRAFDLRGDADLPPGAGLGSSAALSVAVARALTAATGAPADDDRVARIADAGERCFHANPSGVDVALATRGGAGLYRRGAGLTQLDAQPVELVIALSGQPRRTAAMVEKVGAALAAAPEAVGARLAELGTCAERGARAWCGGDLEALGGEMDRAHAGLAALGLSTDLLDDLVALARAAGALGAKLTGAGGGGAVIALAPGEGAVEDAWRRAGHQVVRCQVGGRP